MSVKRYEFELYHCNGGEMLINETGDYVSYEDFVSLEQKLAESQREFRAADATIENLQMQVEKLAAENAGLKAAAVFAMAPDMWEELGGNVMRYQYQEWYADRLKSAMEIPATDAFLAEVRAQGVDEFLRGSQLPYQIATVLADYDNVDDATLQTVIWSGQPPEPDGDVWHLEYVSRGNAIVRAVLKELRKGVQS